MKYLILLVLGLFVFCECVRGDVSSQSDESVEKVEADLGASRDASRTDDEVVKREEEAIKLDGLNVSQLKEIRDKAEKFTFQAEVNRMMKLIINSLYRNKEIFLRELISNGSDALDKIRLLSLTNPNVLDTNPTLNIRIKADKEARMLHITDSGIGMTRADLVNNLGTIAKSGTAEFLNRMQEAASSAQDMNDMIGQFGVGFYSAFLVADRIIVTTKHNDDKQYIWESDASSYSIAEDPRGDTLKRGTTVSLELKPEALDFLEIETIKSLVKKYSQFINFPIYLWNSKMAVVEEPIEQDEVEAKKSEEGEDDIEIDEDDDDAPKTRKVEKTVWDWEMLNVAKPIWTRKPNEITDDEYNEFYKSLTKDTTDPLMRMHFVAEGEVTFKSVLYIPKAQPTDSFNKYGSKTDNIRLYVRRVFITDEFADMMPSYLAFIQGLVDSDDLPLNVSREMLQQHKLIKIIKKKLVRKALDMIRKIPRGEYDKFWKEYSTNIKLGVVEDTNNRARLSKLLMFQTSKGKDMTTLSEYVSRMKPKQEKVFYIAGTDRKELERSPFVERLLRKGYEVLYLVEAVDEYTINALPDFDGKKFQNIAKEGFTISTDTESVNQLNELKKTFEPLTKWFNDIALKDKIVRAEVSERLSSSPCALVATFFGVSGNMERLSMSNAHRKSDDASSSYYLNQRKMFEINPRHPLIKELLKRVEENPEDEIAKDTATMLFRTSTLRSGFMLRDVADYALSVENMMKRSLGISEDEQPEEEDDDVVPYTTPDEEAQLVLEQEDEEEEEEHDEL